MKVSSQLKFVSGISISAVLALVPMMIWTSIKFDEAKSEKSFFETLQNTFAERLQYRDQYFLYREDQARKKWEDVNKHFESLLMKVSKVNPEVTAENLALLNESNEAAKSLFYRIVKNTENLKSQRQNKNIFEEMDKRLLSQLQLRATTVRDEIAKFYNHSQDHETAAYRNLLIAGGTMILILVLVSVLVSVQLTRLLSIRLEMVREGTTKLALGDLNFRIKMFGDDEFSDIAQSINEMAGKLQLFEEQQNIRLETSRLIQRIDQSIATSANFENLVKNAISAVIAEAHWSVAAYWRINQKSKKQESSFELIEIVAQQDERFNEYLELSRKTKLSEGADFMSWMKLNNQVNWIPTIENDEKFPGKHLALASGLRGAVIIPIIASGDPVGSLVIFSEREISRDSRTEIEFAGIGKRVGQAIQKLEFEVAARTEQVRRQEMLAGISESAIVAITDQTGKINFVNEKFINISGYSRAELLGQDHRILNSGVHPKSFFANLWKTINGGRVWRGEICNRKKDGTLYWVETVISGIHDERGERQFLAVRFEVTERKAAVLKLHESQQLLATVLDTLPVAVFGKNIADQFRMNIWNRQAEELFGIKAADLLGKCDHEMFPKEQADFFMLKDIEASKSSNVIDIPEETARTAKGDVILHTRKVVVRNEKGEAKILLGISENITEKKLQESLLKEAEIKLIRSSKLASLGELSAGVAHEINNPLASISGSAGLLLKFLSQPEKLKAKVEAIQKASERIAKIVLGLRKFSRTNEKLNLKTFSIANIVKEAVILTDSKRLRYNTAIKVDCKTESLIKCDEVEIEQVFVNLISNAIDAVKDLPERWVKVSVVEESGLVVVRVFDSGHGIPDKIREKIFQPFFTTKPVGEGTGLGLSISKGILDEHNASITVVKENPNTCFEIRFPLAEGLKNAS